MLNYISGMMKLIFCRLLAPFLLQLPQLNNNTLMDNEFRHFGKNYSEDSESQKL